MWEIIPESIKELHKLFNNHGKNIFPVGGCVRDFLLKKKPKDWDLATDATPDEVLSICKGYRTNEVGKSFGVVIVYIKGEEYEVATFRTDQYGDKLGETRNPDVVFSTIEEDVKRRDTTLNGLFYDLEKKEIIDLVGGVADISDKLIRFIGEPELRITEDPLRIMRFIRQGLKYKLVFEDASVKAIIENVHKLSIITPERIFEELVKTYEKVENYNDYIRHLIGLGAAAVMFDSVNINTHYTEDKKFSSMEMCFAHLFSGNSTIGLQKKMIQDFKMTKDFSRKVVFFLDVLSASAETALDLYDKKIISGTSNEEIEEWFDFIEEFTDDLLSKSVRAFTRFTPSVKAAPLMELGWSGTTLGKEIKRLELVNYQNL